MARLLLNLKGINVDSPEPVPEGVYTVVLDTADSQMETSMGGKPNFAVWLNIEGHPEYSGRRVRDWFYTNREAVWRLKRVLKMLGYPDDDLESEAFDFDTNMLHGEALRVRLGRRENPKTGKIYNEVLDYMPLPGDTADKPLEATGTETPKTTRSSRRRSKRDF